MEKITTMYLYRNFRTQEEIDQYYNLAARTPDSQTWIEWYLAKSKDARASMEHHANISFGPTLDETLDIYPADDPEAPILLFIHGGYWVRFHSSDFAFVARGLVQLGVTVVVLNYSLCPKVSLDEITRQSRAAVAWLRTSNLEFNGSREKIFVSGHSAGGHQTTMLLGTDWQDEYGLPVDTLRGGIAISGIFDLNPLLYSFIQPKLLLNNETIKRQSPLFDIPEKAPALLLSYGMEESPEFIRQSDDMYAAWKAAELPVSLFKQQGKHHFSAIEGLDDPESDLCKNVRSFIDDQLSNTSV